MAKQRAYIESSVISYLAAYLAGRLSKDDRNRVRQQLTALWWERRHEWDCVVSATVVVEVGRGNSDAAAHRLAIAKSFAEVPITPEADLLTDLLVSHKLVPESVRADAVHLAAAAVNGAQVLVTWNQKHLANPALRSRIESLIRKQGWQPAKVVTPGQLLEELA